jgi:hypothetical protein
MEQNHLHMEQTQLHMEQNHLHQEMKKMDFRRGAFNLFG